MQNWIFSVSFMSNEPEHVTNAHAEHEEDDDRVPEEEVTEVEGWAPSVTLEVKAQVVTGEEEEETLFTQRSKLLRYVIFPLCVIYYVSKVGCQRCIVRRTGRRMEGKRHR